MNCQINLPINVCGFDKDICTCGDIIKAFNIGECDNPSEHFTIDCDDDDKDVSLPPAVPFDLLQFVINHSHAAG